jgi:hypothetical protein
MMWRRRPHELLFAMICFGLILLCSTTAMAEKAFLDNVTITNTRDNLIAYFDVQNAFTPKINEAVLNGVPTTFTFYISLYRARESWVDEKISSHKIFNTLKYNALREDFSLSRPWKSKEVLAIKSLDAARKQMTDITGFNVVPMNQLIRGKRYQIRIKAEMKKIKLPLYLHHVFFFLSLWNFETDWYTMDFIY